MLRNPPAHLPMQGSRPAFLTLFSQVLSDIRSIVFYILGALHLAGTACGLGCSWKGQAFGPGLGAQGEPVDRLSLLVIYLATQILRPLAPQPDCSATLRVPNSEQGIAFGFIARCNAPHPGFPGQFAS